MNEPSVPCSGCGGYKPVGDMLYDYHACIFFCDHECFDEWADDNLDEVIKYYYRMNVE